jgi:uncharacterized membrane protein HdeD (DUF308 family)
VIVHPLIVSILAPAILIMLIGFLGIVIGGIGLVQAFKGGGWAAALWGTLAVIFGLILIFNPLIGVGALPWILGVVALIAGLALIVVAIRLRKG